MAAVGTCFVPRLTRTRLCFFLMRAARVRPRLVGGEVFGSHAGGVLEGDKEKGDTNKTDQCRATGGHFRLESLWAEPSGRRFAIAC